MSKERWFPMKYELPDGTPLGTLFASDGNWQIYRVDRRNKVLAARTALADGWVSSGLLAESVLQPFSFGKDKYVAIGSGADQHLVPVSDFTSPETKADALAFAVSLRESRRIVEDVPLHDAIYVERFSRLLPTWTVSEMLDDSDLLGRWLTGGVAVSASSFRRLSSLLGWMDKDDVGEVVEAAGFLVPDEAGGLRARTRTESRKEFRDKAKTGSRRKEHREDEKNVLPDSGEQMFSLPGRPNLEAFFNEHVIDIVIHSERYKALGISFPTAIVLYGPPGCGKTFAVERLVEFLDWPIFHVDSNSVGSPYIHETSRKVSEVFDKAMDVAPSVIVIDEMESYLSDRQMHQSTGLHHVEEVAEFLRRIPEAASKHVLVIGMTNRLEMIDSAILRRGRFDHVIEVGMPLKKEVAELVNSLLHKVPLESGVTSAKVIAALTGRPLSDAAFAVREAARMAARAGKHALDQESLNAAVAKLPPLKDKDGSRPIGFVWD
jgi:SpoVK/Ycf46/Vps4 family AAA+-type ATPase